MRSFLLLLFLLAHLISAENHNASGVLELAVANLPPCALQCALTTVGKSTCELTDLNCIKTNKDLQHELSVCVKASCRIREALTAKKFLLNLIGAPIRDNTKIGTVTCLVVGCLAVLAYLLRVVARLPRFGAYWGPDDWVITAATIVSIPMTVCAEILNHLAFGKDMWEVPLDNITKVLKIFYFLELLYLTAIGLTKISILLFYLRIFPQRKLRQAIYITIVLCVLYIIGFVTATALQCLPVHISWERWDGEHHGRCFNLNAGAWASAGVNIVLDLIVILLPTRQVAKLSMSRRRRLGVMVMFLLGGFVTVVSVLRLKYMVEFAHTQNVTWDYMPIGVWSAVETHVGLVVACMPAMRSLLRSLRDRRSPRPPPSTGYYEDGTRDSNKKNSRKNERSLFSLLSRSNVDREEFVELGEGVTGSCTDGKGAIVEDSIRNGSVSEKSRAHSLNSNEDIQPLAAQSAPTGRVPAGGIVVQTEYSVERTSIDLGTYRQKFDAK